MKMNDTTISKGGQRDLAAGVLKQAAGDLRRFHNAPSPIERELYLDAYRWVMSDDYAWPFSFPNVCRLLNRVPEDVRQEILGDLSLGTLNQWIRRCHRATRRLSDSITHRFRPSKEARTDTPPSLMQTSY